MKNSSAIPAKAPKVRAPRNQTLTITADEAAPLLAKALVIDSPVTVDELQDNVIHQDIFACLPNLPLGFVDLLIIDPPYNLTKKFGESTFAKTTTQSYSEYVESWLVPLLKCLKPTASVYVCCDWPSSYPIQQVLEKYLIIRNRITWEREKGRGAKSNWKNCSEDIWFCTLANEYYFNVEAVKLKRKVIAPYRNADGDPKDWEENDGGNYRLTHPSNLWTDISIPFWSMPENTDHPTQKPEKLLAKLILASSRLGDFIFDPFLGSGTTAVVAKKLGRHFAGVELEPAYCQMAIKRLEAAHYESPIQGYHDGYFWERNSLVDQKSSSIVEKGPVLEAVAPIKKRGRPKKPGLLTQGLFDE